MSHVLHLIRCHIGAEAYCFEMSSVASVCQATTVRSGPQIAPDAAIGWVTSPGDENVPVFRLADRLDQTTPVTDVRRQHIIVVRTSLGLQGFQVDAVSRVIPVPAEHVRAVPSLLNNPARRLFKSVVIFHDSLGLVLSAERLGSGISQSQLVSDTALATGHCANQPAASAVPLASRVSDVPGSGAGRIVLFPLTGSAFAGHDVFCGLSATQVVEIVEPLSVVPVPFAPPQVAGMVLWRDQAVPALRLHESLGLPAESPTRRMVILRNEGELFALSTAHVLRARRFPLPHRPCVPPSEFQSDVLWGAFQSESEVLVIPNLTRLTRPQSRGIVYSSCGRD